MNVRVYIAEMFSTGNDAAKRAVIPEASTCERLDSALKMSHSGERHLVDARATGTGCEHPPASDAMASHTGCRRWPREMRA